MDELLENLFDTLDRMTAVYKEMLQAAEEKQEHIISGDIDKLEAVIFRERNMAERIVLLEQKRRYVMESLAQQSGRRDTSSSLQRLAEQIEYPFRSKLEMKRETIIAAALKVQEVNNVNTSLTRYSLEYVNSLIKSLCSEPLDNTIYQQTGKVKAGDLKRIVFEASA
ncbi:MAG: flagellar protein FlgN [Candidatus Scalindua sp.]|nr:flagellar protein FlgN [Candidatus Scalindua sp.]